MIPLEAKLFGSSQEWTQVQQELQLWLCNRENMPTVRTAQVTGVSTGGQLAIKITGRFHNYAHTDVWLTNDHQFMRERSLAAASGDW